MRDTYRNGRETSSDGGTCFAPDFKIVEMVRFCSEIDLSSIVFGAISLTNGSQAK